MSLPLWHESCHETPELLAVAAFDEVGSFVDTGPQILS